MQKTDRIYMAVGIAAMCILLLPWAILGEGAVVTYHDQLDGEMIAYMLQAKHLFEGDCLPEFMNGASKTALTPPAPASVLLFLTGNYEAALFIMQLLGSLLGFAGMFLLVKDVTGKGFPAFVAGGLYGALPFLPVYGFSQFGLPMLVWCVLQLKKDRHIWVSLAYGVLFAVNSSLALVGFAVLAALGVWLVAEAGSYVVRDRQPAKEGTQEKVRGKLQGTAKQRGFAKTIGRLAALWMLLCIGYVVTNLPLLKQILGLGDSIVSHKTEYALAPESFVSGWVNGLLYGGQHSQDYHLSFLLAGMVVLVLAYVSRKSDDCKKPVGWALCAVGVNAVLAALSALWNSGIGIVLRGNLGALGAFQVDRFLWLSPCLWYLFLGCILAIVIELWKNGYKKVSVLGGVLLAAALCVCSVQILKNSDVKSNIQKLRNPDYAAMSYGDYYAVGVYEQVADFMAEYTGREPSEYRVVSLGIDPAAALYHGFYCLDGYSNNYSLEYKHAFRKVIAPALQESDYLRDYYDDWGNRCYLFGSECPGYYTIEKNGFYFSHLELNTEALASLGGEYLFSAAYIANAEELGLKLLREEAFETAESYYRIFVYEVNER